MARIVPCPLDTPHHVLCVPCVPCRRESTSVEDVVYAHISGMDALARGLRNAAAMAAAGQVEGLVADRYASWHEEGGLGQKIRAGEVGHICWT